MMQGKPRKTSTLYIANAGAFGIEWLDGELPIEFIKAAPAAVRMVRRAGYDLRNGRGAIEVKLCGEEMIRPIFTVIVCDGDNNCTIHGSYDESISRKFFEVMQKTHG